MNANDFKFSIARNQLHLKLTNGTRNWEGCLKTFKQKFSMFSTVGGGGQISNFGLDFFGFFFGVFGFSILADFDKFNGFWFSRILVGYNTFYKTIAGLYWYKVCY